MKRSEINGAIATAKSAFCATGWALPPEPRWDVTDFGLGDFSREGLTLVNLAEEKEYCEKLMFTALNQATPLHTHKRKKEDIICRAGELIIELWDGDPTVVEKGLPATLHRNGKPFAYRNGDLLTLRAGERVTLESGNYHSFWAGTPEGCVVGEVSTANDDTCDNFFVNTNVGRYPEIDEDEAPVVKLVSDK